jgi:murein DD-endopeptidase MepM/ murein hydrolase activator NlpD
LPPDKSRFTEYLVQVNTLRFKRWVFEPGMLFSSESKWWGGKGRRSHRHNGLDLRFYENHDGILEIISEGTKIPLIYEGKIVRIIEDFLGHTVFAAHEIFHHGSQLFTIYGHVQPVADVQIDGFLSEGKVIAILAGTKIMKVPAHLHLSLAFIPKTIRVESLTWQTLDESEDIIFLDPKDIVE